MTTHSIRFDHCDLMQGDHQRLQEGLSRLEERLMSAAMTRVQTDRELARIEAELEQHFAREESGGFFEEILDLSPELGERIHELLREHQEFRAIFRSLRRTSRWACGESGARDGWLAELADFHRRFDQHESAEHELQHHALQQDLGAAD
jgi:hemerythrin-like domain-containing protein